MYFGMFVNHAVSKTANVRSIVLRYFRPEVFTIILTIILDQGGLPDVLAKLYSLKSSLCRTSRRCTHRRWSERVPCRAHCLPSFGCHAVPGRNGIVNEWRDLADASIRHLSVREIWSPGQKEGCCPWYFYHVHHGFDSCGNHQQTGRAPVPSCVCCRSGWPCHHSCQHCEYAADCCWYRLDIKTYTEWLYCIWALRKSSKWYFLAANWQVSCAVKDCLYGDKSDDSHVDICD